ncbi:MAG: carotenoid oxygenase [Ilumatobacteraceae bacterium]|nr:carotenoid oxygenase [Ilumatobacteraceae bacterium]
MMHDFVITETKVVIFDLPAVMDVQALIDGGTGFYWDADRGARIGVLERGAPGSTIRWIDVDPFWVFHFLNAHDVAPDDAPNAGAGAGAGAIEVVGCRSSQLNASFDGSEVPPEVRPMLHRWRIDLGTGAVVDEQLDDRPTDFPRINEAYAGLANRYGYGGHSAGFVDGEPPFDGVTRFDLQTGATATHRYGPGQVCGESVFAADPASTAEDGGWLLNFVHDLAEDRSDVVVLDAGTLDEVARVHLPRRVPFGFHGSFLP